MPSIYEVDEVFVRTASNAELTAIDNYIHKIYENDLKNAATDHRMGKLLSLLTKVHNWVVSELMRRSLAHKDGGPAIAKAIDYKFRTDFGTIIQMVKTEDLSAVRLKPNEAERIIAGDVSFIAFPATKSMRRILDNLPRKKAIVFTEKKAFGSVQLLLPGRPVQANDVPEAAARVPGRAPDLNLVGVIFTPFVSPVGIEVDAEKGPLYTPGNFRLGGEAMEKTEVENHIEILLEAVGMEESGMGQNIAKDESAKKQHKKQRDPTTVQTLIFDKDKFDAAAARKWAREHDFKAGKVDIKEDSIRIRQRSPGDFQDGSFRTITLREGIKAVIGRLKKGMRKDKHLRHGFTKDVEFVHHEVKKLTFDDGTREDQRLVYGVVYEPNKVDAQGDWAPPETIQRAAHNYMIQSRNVKVMHRFNTDRIKVVENYIAPQNLTIGNRDVAKDTWIMVLKVLDDKVWDAVKSGKLRGLSLGGRSTVQDGVSPRV